MRRLALAAAASAAILAGMQGAASQEGPYLFDLLQQQRYRAAWDGMLGQSGPIAHWVWEFSQTYNGVATPSREVWIGGLQFRYAHVCKPHDCGSNQLHVLFAPGAERAWALLASGNRTDWYGNPDRHVQNVLVQLASE